MHGACVNSRDISFIYLSGNTYYIENIADREAKLVFTQARKLAPTEEEIQHQQMVNNRRSTEWGSELTPN